MAGGGQVKGLQLEYFEYIERELFNYDETKKEIEDLREDILSEAPAVSELATTIMTGTTSDSTGRKAEKLLTNKVLVRMAKTVKGIDRALSRLSESHEIFFHLRYQRGLSWQMVCMEMPTSRRSYFRIRRELVYMVAQELGFISWVE